MTFVKLAPLVYNLSFSVVYPNTGKHAPEGEVITIALIIEVFFQGHEELGYAFVSQFLRDMFPNLTHQ
jgi:hypothetical protein